MTAVRVSILNIPADHIDHAAQLMADAESTLISIRDLPGLRAYFVGIDRNTSQLSNVSIWDTEEHAKAMSSFPPMLDLAATFAAIPGVTFVRPIPNFTDIWHWGNADGGATTKTDRRT